MRKWCRHFLLCRLPIRGAIGKVDYTTHSAGYACTNSALYRDDLTVEVIFFGHGERAQNKSQEIVVNEEATAPPRAKL